MHVCSPLRLMLFAALGATCLPARAHSQAATTWRSLGWSTFEEVTGKRDSVQKFARNFGLDIYVLRTMYRSDRTNAEGKAWRNSYMTARIDCGKRTMELLRFDYYNADSTLVGTVAGGITFTADMIATSDSWTAFYNYSCALRKPD